MIKNVTKFMAIRINVIQLFFLASVNIIASLC